MFRKKKNVSVYIPRGLVQQDRHLISYCITEMQYGQVAA